LRRRRERVLKVVLLGAAALLCVSVLFSTAVLIVL
jgi:hypothetical protein